MDYLRVTEPHKWLGKKVHVAGWNPGCVFVLVSYEDGVAELKTPSRGKVYTTKNTLLHIRKDQLAMTA